MFPDLIDLGFLHLKTYGACMAIGFVLCWTLVERLGHRKDLSNLLLSLMISGVVGSRIAYVIEHWRSEFAANPFNVIRVDQGGLMFYGGLILAIVVFFAWCFAKKERPMALADLLCVVIPLGHACGRLGCFFYGCCYGKLSSGPLAVTFPRHSPAWFEQLHAGLITSGASRSLPVLPTQLFEAAALLALFAVLLFVYRKRRAYTAGLYLIGYAAIRFGLEYLRGDPRAAVLGLSISQAISIGMAVIGLVCLLREKPVWLRFFRIVNLPTVPGDVLCGAAAVSGFWFRVSGSGLSVSGCRYGISGGSVVAGCVAAAAIYLFGLADNDIVGAKSDGPERPIPADEISLGAARVARAACLLAAVVVGSLAALPPDWWIAALLLLVATVVYNRTKNFVVMGLCRGLNVVCGAAAVAGSGFLVSGFWFLVAGVAVVWTVYIAAVTKYSEGEAEDSEKRRLVGALIGGIVYLQLAALMAAYFIAPSLMTRNLLLAGAAMLIALRLMKRLLPKVSAS